MKMNLMFKTFGVLLTLIMLTFFMGCGSSSSSTATVTYDIGVLLPESGYDTELWQAINSAIKVAADDANAYLATTEKKFKINPVFKDTKGDPDLALIGLQELNSQGIKMVLGPLKSSEVSKIQDYAVQNNMLLMSPVSTAPSLAMANNTFRFVQNDVFQAKAIAQKLKEKSVKTIIIVNRTDTWGNDLTAELKKAVGIYNITVADNITYSPSTTSYTTIVSSLESKVTTAQSYYTHDTEVAVVLLALDETKEIFNAADGSSILKNTLDWYGSDGNVNIGAITSDNIAAEFALATNFLGTTYIGPFSAGETPVLSPLLSNDIATVSERIKAVYSLSSLNEYALIGYDITWLAALSYLSADNPLDVSSLKSSLLTSSDTFIGYSGEIYLNGLGDRVTGSYGFYKVVESSGIYSWALDSTISKFTSDNQQSNRDDYIPIASVSDTIIFIETMRIDNYYGWYEFYLWLYDEMPANYTNFKSPKGVALDDTGNIYFTEAGGCKVIKYNKFGNYLKHWGGYTTSLSDTDKFFYPYGIAVNNEYGLCYVVDKNACKVKIFDLEGNYISEFGSYGYDTNQFLYPTYIEVDNSGETVYVVDPENERLLVFDKDGNYLASTYDSYPWKSFGGLTLTTDTDLYVVLQGEDKIEKYGKNLEWKQDFGGYGLNAGEFINPIDVAYANNNLYVLEDYNIKILNPLGNLLYKWNGFGVLNNPTNIVVNNSDNIYVANSGNNSINVYKRYNAEDIKVLDLDRDTIPYKIAYDKTNEWVYTIMRIDTYDTENNRYRNFEVVKCDTGLNIIGKLDYDFESGARAIDVDNNGNVFVTYNYPPNIIKFDSNGDTVAEFLAGNPEMLIRDFTIDNNDNLYALAQIRQENSYNYLYIITKFDNDLELIDTNVINDTRIYYPSAIDMDDTGNFYITIDYSEIAVIDTNYEVTNTFGEYGMANNELLWITDIKISSDGYIYILDDELNKLSKFDLSGNFIEKRGNMGSGLLEFVWPYGVTCDDYGFFYVTDSGNRRIQKFKF